MSGGFYDYICFKVFEIKLRNCTTDPRRAALQKILKLIGDAMYAIEWVDSSDWAEGQEHESIDAVFAALNADPATLIKANAFDSLKATMQEYFK